MFFLQGWQGLIVLNLIFPYYFCDKQPVIDLFNDNREVKNKMILI